MVLQIDEKLIQDLRQYISVKTGKSYFGRIKSTPKDLMVSCPYHKGGQERKPSMGIKLYTDEYQTAGTCNCFTCKITTNISRMVKDLLGDKYNEDEVEGRFGLKEGIINAAVVKEQHNTVKFVVPNNTVIPEAQLREYRYYNDYLKYRGITERTANVYDIGYDSINDHITFPIKDVYNRCIGVGRRAIQEKKYYYPSGMKKPLYGIYELPQIVRHLYCVEGPFNLWSLYQYRKTGVALLGTGSSSQYHDLLKIECKDYVLALDGDDAGRDGTYKLGTFLKANNKIVYVADVLDGKDINDMTEQQFRDMAVLTFDEWRYKYGR